MARYATMFTPTMAALAAGVTPASWMILVDEGQRGRDQLIQRAAARTADHLGMDQHAYAPREDGEAEGLSFYGSVVDTTPLGTICWVEAPFEMAMAA